ncbi:MAG: DMT family transporter [Rhizobiales bacterium]|nr:DMT family transporter [Hyphomicrobiales bacterium]
MPAFLNRFWSNPYLLLTLATMFWGGNAVASRLAVGEASPLLMTCLRWLGVCFLIAPFYRREIAAGWPLIARRPWRIILAAILGQTGFNVLMYVGAHYTSALNIGLLQGATPALVFLGVWLAYGTPISGLQAVGVAVTMVGVAVISSGGSLAALLALELNKGDAMMLVAVLLYAGYTVAMRDRPAMPAIAFFLTMALFAAAASLPLVPIEYALGNLQWPTLKGWAIVAYVTIFPSFFSQIFYIRGIELIGPGRAGVFYNMLPVFAVLFAVAGLGEAFGWPQALAMALILGGIALAERKPPNRRG